MTRTPPHIHELSSGQLRLAVRPDLGGSLAGLWHGSTPVMRSTEPAELTSARLSACFPLVPYSNRIGHRQFRWQGRDLTTAANFPDSPHSLHGVAWTRAWDTLSASPTDLTLRYAHAPDEHWPFAFDAWQHITLAADQLTLRHEIRNTDDSAQPVGLGWHPYFPARDASHLSMTVTHRWERDATLLPTHAVPQAGIEGEVREFDFDHCFEGWAGEAMIRDAQFELSLRSSLPYVVVFTPPGRGHFCVEPVSHVNNALKMSNPLEHGVRQLEPGETASAWMTLKITER